QPDPSLSGRVIAALADGTPLVTRKALGAGQVVLFHVTANAEWSSLPLSGLFVQMLERLAVSTRPARPKAAELVGTTWVAARLLDGFGQVGEAGAMAGVAGERIAAGELSAELPPGLYAGQDRRIALNVMAPDSTINPALWPPGVKIDGFQVARKSALAAYLLAAALALLAVDLVASLWLSGRLRGARSAATTATVAAALTLTLLITPQARAQSGPSEQFAVDATAEVVLAYVVTGNDAVDRVSQAGLRGLSDVLFARTSVEPAEPIAVNLEFDELSFFPMLYWPVTPDQPLPSAEAYGRLNRYLRTGGMILFDTRDADVARFGAASENGRKLRQLARPLDIPPLERVPSDHVLTRT
ncbi:MAG: DUF4159 domain-containing protein, partial [Paracoccaceae bacterium]